MTHQPTHSSPAATPSFDYLLVGGGLQNGLLALALLDRQPGARIALVERAGRLGGNHTWCFHSDDVPRAARRFVDPLVAHRWPGYAVRFPGLTRALDTPYAAVTSDSLHAVVSQALGQAPGCALFLGCAAERVARTRVTLADGRALDATVVIDARGPDAHGPMASTGYQKFLGLEVELGEPHGLERPVLMDATVAQDQDGYRFFYLLPFGPRRMLIEETYFSDTPVIHAERWRANIAAYAADKGFRITEIVREEQGVLPMPWAEPPTVAKPASAKQIGWRAGAVATTSAPHEVPIRAGYQGGFFHPATGYSFPVAVRLADHVSSLPPARLGSEAMSGFVAEHRKQAAFGYFLNRLLFVWFPPERRYHVLERFYTLPEDTIRRFYALTLTRGDQARILVGKPPRGMSLRAALSRRRSLGRGGRDAAAIPGGRDE